MRKKKRLIGLVLCLVLAMTLLQTSALADSGADPESETMVSEQKEGAFDEMAEAEEGTGTTQESSDEATDGEPAKETAAEPSPEGIKTVPEGTMAVPGEEINEGPSSEEIAAEPSSEAAESLPNAEAECEEANLIGTEGDGEENTFIASAPGGIDCYEALTDAIDGETGPIDVTLTDSFSTFGTKHITLTSGAKVVIDLNGYTITADDGGKGALFTVPGGASLTITDSRANRAVKGDGVSVGADDAGRIAGVTGRTDGGTELTYYVTQSEKVKDSVGMTKETRYPYTVTSAGMICTSGQNHSLFSVTGGTLNIESGFFYGENASSGSRAIDASAGKVNLSGGYIFGFEEAYGSGHGEEVNGGAVRVTGSAVLTISEDAVLAANKAGNGGAVDVADGGTLHMTGGVISGNEATENDSNSEWYNDYGGGGIHACGSGTAVNISGGYVTNNVSDCTGYHDGGGGILVNGSALHMSGGYITGNKAACSGGGIRTAYEGSGGQGGSSVFMTGGHLCANYVNESEGGGLYLDSGSYCDIAADSAVYINNNKTDTAEDWGGGGVFCANGAAAYLYDALITGNTAGGFGGGVAGCSTGRIAIADVAGAAIYGNTAQGEHTSGSNSTKHDDTNYALRDPVFLANGYQDYYCALKSMVSGKMPGGGAAGWQGSADGIAVKKGSVGTEDYLWAAFIMGLTANPGSKAINSAQSAANVYIKADDSYTNVGGVLSNGYLFLGDVENYAIGDAIEVKADKQLIDLYGEKKPVKEGQFTFAITAESGEVVSTGTTQSDGSIFFDRKLPFHEAGTFTFSIKETSPGDPGILLDPSVYTLAVTVGKSDKKVGVSGSAVEYTYYNIIHISLTKNDEEEPLMDEDINSPEEGVNTITIPSPAFVNYETDKISVTVHKTWQDEEGNAVGWPEKTDSIKVYLYQNDKVYGDPVLLTQNNPSYTWTDLPAGGTDEDGDKIVYTVTEDETSYYSGEVTGSAEDGFEIINILVEGKNSKKKTKVENNLKKPDGGDNGRKETVQDGSGNRGANHGAVGKPQASAAKKTDDTNRAVRYALLLAACLIAAMAVGRSLSAGKKSKRRHKHQIR